MQQSYPFVSTRVLQSKKSLCIDFAKRFAYKVASQSAITIVITASAHGTLPNLDDLSDILRNSAILAAQQEIRKYMHPKQNVKPVLSRRKNEMELK
ncbi:MAG: hypothetical protein ACOYN8_19455 [Pseudanabaena sp.]|jgi:hypothetical protein